MEEGRVDNVPRHIAIIMDGNGRWAKERIRPRAFGHRAGTKALKSTVEACGEIGVKHLTVYVFSSENWERPAGEVGALMSLLVEMLHKEVKELNEKNVKLRAIGNLDRLPTKTREELLWGIRETANNTGLQLNLALSYGSREEIVDACKKIATEVRDGRMGIDDITTDSFSEYLYDPNLPDPELLIRTSGEMRISNYLLWQIAYTEIVVTSTLWPDFGRKELIAAINEYNHRIRRFGKVLET